MAIYHASIKTLSRGRGDSAVAAAAYRGGLDLIDGNGVRRNYRPRRSKVEATICMAPKDAPDWASKPEELWRRADSAEKRLDATVCREFLVALPHELDQDQRLALVEDLCSHLVARYGFAVQASIHKPPNPGGVNWHVHILYTTRYMTPEGLGKKVRVLDARPSGREEVHWVREMVALRINEHLAGAGLSTKVDHRTLEAQSRAAEVAGDLVSALLLAREPTRHLGKAVHAMDRKGVASERGAHNEAIRQRNDETLQALLESFRQEGRLVPTPEWHSLEAALRERQQARREAERSLPSPSPTPAATVPQPVRVRRPPRGTPTLAGTLRVTPSRDGAARSAREREIELLMLEAQRTWLEGIDEATRTSNLVVELLLAQRADMLRQYGHRVVFHRDCQELARAIESLRRDQAKWPTSFEAMKRTQMELNYEKLKIHELEPQPPRTALWRRREWAQRRRAQELRIAERRQARDKAREATDPEAQTRYVRDTQRSLAELQKVAARMNAAYGIQVVPEQPMPEERPAVLVPENQGQAKGRRRGPGYPRSRGRY